MEASPLFPQRAKVLFAPLDWGLGHASRCVPLIRKALENECRVVVAASGNPLALLKQELGNSVSYVNIPGYNIRYASSGNMVSSIGVQLPKILMAVVKEHFWLRKYLKHHPMDMVISDNRYGLFSRKTTCVFMTHQLNIPTGFFQSLVNLINHFFIRQFSACWVPDNAFENNLSGILSHGMPLYFHIKPIYIGPLSRWTDKHLSALDKSIDILCVLSGPEPQRSLLEAMVYAQMNELNLRCVMVRGLAKPESDLKSTQGVTVVPMVSGEALLSLILSARLVVARSGYSTLMDLHSLKVSAAFIPTPGQTEQAYLAKRMHTASIANYQLQENLNLGILWHQRNNFKGFGADT